MTDQQLEDLFKPAPAPEPELFEGLKIEEESKSPPGIIRCACGAMVTIRMPCLCSQCKAVKDYWRNADGTTVKLTDLDLGRLTMIQRTLGTRAEESRQSWPERYREIEIALDIVFNEIGSRDKEIDQQRGILRGLMKGMRHVPTQSKG